MEISLIIIICLALAFDLLNGMNDSSNIVATMISSRALPPRTALWVTAVCEFSGPFIFGVAVAKTIGHDIVLPETINEGVIIAALISAILWDLLAWRLGLPCSSTHALVGGLIGAVAAGASWQAIQIPGLIKVFVALFASPIVGLLAGFLLTRLVYALCWDASPRVNWIFKRGQIISSVALALSHGTNDSQKTMGIITLALMTGGYLSTFEVPIWVVIMCAGVIALGTGLGNRRMIRTLGSKFYKIRQVHGFNAQASSALVILIASLVGGPVSTTQVVSSSIMGVGAAERLNKVRWGVAGEIATAWLLTIPANILVAAGIYWLVSRFF